MWYVFGFAERRPGALPAGPLGQPTTVDLDDVDGVAIVASAADDGSTWDELEPDRLAAAAVHHDQVLTAAIPQTVVPARFGSFVPSLDAAAELGRVQGDELRRAFDAVRGRAEFGLRVGVGRAPVAGSGRDYLLHRRDQLAGRDHGVDPVLDDVDEIAGAWVERDRTTRSVRLAVLVTPEELSRLRRRLEARRGLSVDLTGPCAPYSFTSQHPEALRVGA